MLNFIENNLNFFILIFLSISFLSLILVIYLKYKDWRKNWISELINNKTSVKKRFFNKRKIDQKIKAVLNYKFYYLYFFNFFNFLRLKRKLFFRQLPFFYLPSISSIVLLFSIFIIIFFFSHRFDSISLKNFFDYNFYISERGSNYYNNYLNILTGLTGIIIALVIFIAESVRNNKDKIQKQLLLKETLLWPLTVIIILSFLNFIYFRVNFLSILLIILVMFLSIRAFYKGIRITLDPQKNKIVAENLFKNRVKLIINNSILGRIGNNILFNKLGCDKNIKIEYTLSKGFIPNQKEYIYIESEKDGYITDIHLGELKKMADELEKYANKLNFSIHDEKKIFLQTQAAEKSTNAVAGNQTIDKVSKVYLLKRFRDYLTKDSVFNKDGRIVFALPKEFEECPESINLITRKTNQIFKFEEMETSSDELSRELKDVKIRIITAIHQNNSSNVEDNISIYIKVAEYFLSEFHKFGGGFNYEQAQKERASFPEEEFNEIRWIHEDIWELLSLAVKGNNKNIIRNIAYLPIIIASRSITAKDHYLFQKFLPAIIYLYRKSDNKNAEVRDFMIDRSWRYIKELADYSIEPNLKNDDRNLKDADLEEYKNYATYLLKIFQELIKVSIDKKDTGSFELFIDRFNGLFGRFLRNRNWRDENSKKEKIRKEIEKSKNEIIFGINSWILNLFKNDKGNILYQNLFDNSKKYLPEDINKLTKIYIGVRNFEKEAFWGWDNWEMIPDGVVRNINVSGKLDYLFCIQALQVLRNKTKEELNDKKISINRDISLTLKGSNGLFSIIDKISVDNSILDEQSINSKEILKELLTEAKKEFEEKEEKELEMEAIDSDKVEEFFKELIKSFESTSILRSLIKEFGVYENNSDSGNIDKNHKLWGYNQIDFKEAFIKNPKTHYVGHSEQYGRGMAESENDRIYSLIINKIANKISVNASDLTNEIVDYIKKNKDKNIVIISSLNYLIKWDFIKQDKYFNSKPQGKDFEDFEDFEGYFEVEDVLIPIFNIYSRNKKSENVISIINFKKLGKWTQYAPIDKEEDKKDQKEMFLFRIIDLNVDEKLRKEIINEEPKWLNEKEDKEGYLKRRVVFQIYEKSNYKIVDKHAGIIFKVLNKNK